MEKDYPVMLKADTRKLLADYRSEYETEILSFEGNNGNNRRFVSWDATIRFLINKDVFESAGRGWHGSLRHSVVAKGSKVKK